MKLALLAFICLILAIQTSPIDDSVQTKVTLLDSSLLDVVWCGNNEDNDQGVLLLTQKGTVYKTSDRGENWEKMSDLFHTQAIKQVQDLDTKIGVINRIVKSPIDPNVVIFLGSEGINYISEDCGSTLKSYGKGRNFREFQYHPTERDWVLASSWKNCKKTGTQKCDVTKELFLSQNLGKTWERIANYVVQFSWGMKSNKNNENIPVKRIIWSQELGAKGHQKISGWNMKTHLYYSDDFAKTQNIIVNQGNKFLLTEKFIFVAQVRDAESQKVNLLYANPNSKDFDFQFAQINEELKQHSFTILDSQDGSVFLNINHHKPNSPLGAIYKSDSTGGKFVKSLDHNIRDIGDGQCDFEKISGLEGIYLANTYSDKQANEYIQAASAEDSEQIQFETAKNGRTKIIDNLKNFQKKLKESKQTKISFDQGAMWKPLTAPVKDSKGAKIQCDQNKGCSLHLHSVSSKMQYGPFYSSENALGIIMGTGNVGRGLRSRQDEVNTYLSRDAGLTWFEVKKGSHIYEFADHGGLILMADDQKASQFVYFSWDEGLTWSKIKFWDKPVEITNIITEPSNVGQRFIVYGTVQMEDNNKTSKTKGVIITIDFSQLHVQQCQGADSPNSDDSDYELWSPNGKVSPDCLMGRKTTYARRKRLSKCYNGQQFDRVVNVKHCECTEEDWECDVGYERQNGDGACVPSSEYIAQEAPKTCSGYYLVSQGYRKIAGDSCVGGVDHSAYKYACPYFSFMGSNFWMNLLILGGIVYAVYWAIQNKEDSQKYLDALLNFVGKYIKIIGENTPTLGSGNSQTPNSSYNYFDFEKMDLERNDNSAFDENLIQKDDEEQDNDEPEKIPNNDLLQQQNNNSQNNNNQNNNEKEINDSYQQQSHEDSNLLDGGHDDFDDEDGFDPRN